MQSLLLEVLFYIPPYRPQSLLPTSLHFAYLKPFHTFYDSRGTASDSSLTPCSCGFLVLGTTLKFMAGISCSTRVLPSAGLPTIRCSSCSRIPFLCIAEDCSRFLYGTLSSTDFLLLCGLALRLWKIAQISRAATWSVTNDALIRADNLCGQPRRPSGQRTADARQWNVYCALFDYPIYLHRYCTYSRCKERFSANWRRFAEKTRPFITDNANKYLDVRF